MNKFAVFYNKLCKICIASIAIYAGAFFITSACNMVLPSPTVYIMVVLPIALMVLFGITGGLKLLFLLTILCGCTIEVSDNMQIANQEVPPAIEAPEPEPVTLSSEPRKPSMLLVGVIVGGSIIFVSYAITRKKRRP